MAIIGLRVAQCTTELSSEHIKSQENRQRKLIFIPACGFRNKFTSIYLLILITKVAYNFLIEFYNTLIIKNIIISIFK